MIEDRGDVIKPRVDQGGGVMGGKAFLEKLKKELVYYSKLNSAAL
jgi:hypothetical protein